MRYIAQAGDLLGIDLRVTRMAGAYKMTIYCAEGAPGSPLTQVVSVKSGVVVLDAPDGFCDRKLRLRFVAKGVWIGQNFIDSEFVPRHINYLKKEYWK